MKSRIYLVALVGLAMMLVGSEAWARCYVDQNAKGKNDGSSWGDAYVHPQLALVNGCTEIWVAKGVYRPAVKGSPDVSFNIPAGTKIYGGFAGKETSVDDAKPAANITVLSGDIDENDNIDAHQVTTEPRGENSHHVVRLDGTASSGAPVSNSTVLSGFVITGGVADGDDEAGYGGGLYCDGSGTRGSCNPTLSKLVFSGNDAHFGGAIFDNGSGGESSPPIEDVEFDANWAGYFSSNDGPGNAVYNWGCCGGKSNPKFVNVTFAFNRGYYSLVENDGTTAGQSSPFFTNSTIFANENSPMITNRGNGPGSVSSPVFINVTIFHSYNAIASDGSDGGSSSPTIVNSVIDPDGIWEPLEINSASLTIDHSVLRRGCPASAACTSVFDGDSMTSSFGNYGGFTRTLIPLAHGVAINNGVVCLLCPDNDQRGVRRSDGQPDIGAFEWQPSDDTIFKNGFQ